MRQNLTLIIIFCSIAVYGQDLHFSQFYLNPVMLSPATCITRGSDMRASCVYRSQWQSVPVAYESFAGASDFTVASSGEGRLNLGVQLQQDKAGDGGLSWLQTGITAAVSQQVGARQRVGIGFGWSFVQRRVTVGNLTFQNQWGGDSFDPALPSKESFPASSGISPSLAAGLCWQYNAENSRNTAIAGMGFNHINRPDVGFETGGNKIPVRTDLYLEGIVQATEMGDAVIFGAWQQMSTAREMLIGAGYRYILSTGIANHTAVQASIASRIKDALIPSIQVYRNNWILGISYDFNISSFNNATRGRGGMEIALVWNRVPVSAPNSDKTCPVF